MTAFEEYFGRSRQGRWSAPGRVNLIGEYTDINEGHVLPLALPQRTTVEAAARQDRLLRCVSMNEPSPAIYELGLDGGGMPGNWSVYPLAVARSLEASGHIMGGADLLVRSTVPVGSGLSSSAALECAVGSALCDLYGAQLTPMQTALAAQRAERDFVGVPCGIMDQAAAMCCQEGHALLLDTRDLSANQIPLPLAEHDLELLVVDSGVHHDLQTSAYSERKSVCETAAACLGVSSLRDVTQQESAAAIERLRVDKGECIARRARHVLSEQRRVMQVADALRRGDMLAVGALLVEGHDSLRYDFEVSCAELDVVVATALRHGALGARLTGAGFGGAAVVLAPVQARSELASAMRSAFEDHGWRPPAMSTVQASPGARRDD